MFNIARFIAAGFGGGWIPLGPGTFGSLTALIPAWLLIHTWGVVSLWLAWLLLLPVACRATYVVLAQEKDMDPSWIVIDEWLGQWLTLLIIFSVLPAMAIMVILAFIAFRFFDILKPGPIKMIEHMGPDWWSIHADDLLAGIFAGLTLLAGYFLFSVILA